MSLCKTKNLNELSKKEIAKIKGKITKIYAQNPSKENRNEIHLDPKEIYDDFLVRNEFSRDRDKILFSKAFRRLEHKAQVYSHEKGDHYRTRLTHTLEVMQIARSIARNLGLNEDLTEAIALGHDIGHTPFGHAGEDVLDKIMRGEDDLGGKLEYKIDYLGFKHNFYSLKILDNIESKYENYKGLNLTWQVLEGILKHTKIKKNGKKWNIERYMEESKNRDLIENFMYNEIEGKTFSVTLEGQIVDIADEIAQRQHDLDDGLRDIDLKLQYDKIVSKLSDFINETVIKIKKDGKDDSSFEIRLLNELKRKINGSKESNADYIWNSLIRNVIDYFIRDVTLNSIKNICNSDFTGLDTESSDKILNKPLINLSVAGEGINNKIEDYIKNQILNSYNVNRFDGKAVYVIRQLFKAYYTNPRQMPKSSLKILSEQISKNSEEIFSLQLKDGMFKKCENIKDINFNDSPREDVDKLIEILKLNIPLIIKNLEYTGMLNVADTVRDDFNINNVFKEINEFKSFEDFIDNTKKVRFKNVTFDQYRVIKCLLENHYAYLSTICDYIACMTDNFANEEYSKLYLV